MKSSTKVRQQSAKCQN